MRGTIVCKLWKLMRVLALIAVGLGGSKLASAQQTAAVNIERLQGATVLVIQAREISNALVETCVGSGTLIWRDGLILTNAHIVAQSLICNGDRLLIAISKRLDEPPVPSFRAEIVQVDHGRDLALLQIRQDLDGRSLDPRTLTLPYVELGDSANIQLDETIFILGYEGIGDAPIQSVNGPLRGTISGFLAEPSGGDRAWLKTDVPIPGMMSGGGAYDLAGRLIGVPTSSPLITGGSGECVALRDSNSDGFVDGADRCIPLGANSNALRPVNMVQPLFRAATLGLTAEDLPSEETALGPASSVSRLYFASTVRDGQPNTVIASLPANPTSLYLFFDYHDMKPETVYEIRVIVQGVPNQTLSLAPVRWSGEREGTWYFGSSGQALPNGRYQFTVFIDGAAAATRSILIGVESENPPNFTDLVFGLTDGSGNFSGSGYLLPVGEIATARFIYQNMPPGIPWQARWYYEGVLSSSSEGAWLDSANGIKEISIAPTGGLLPGRYRLELGIESRLAATADFVIAGESPATLPRIFENLRFIAAETSAAARIEASANTFSSGMISLFALFDWRQLAAGIPWRARWLVDESIFFEQQTLWRGASSGSGIPTQLRAREQFPDGTYRFELEVAGVVVAGAEFLVGIGQLPVEEVSEPSGIRLSGRVVDAETGAGIVGASFILISEDFAVEDWEWDEAQIFARARSDIQGDFQFAPLLQYRTPYSVYVSTRGYLPVTADGFIVTETTADPLELRIEMTRDRP